MGENGKNGCLLCFCLVSPLLFTIHSNMVIVLRTFITSAVSPLSRSFSTSSNGFYNRNLPSCMYFLSITPPTPFSALSNLICWLQSQEELSQQIIQDLHIHLRPQLPQISTPPPHLPIPQLHQRRPCMFPPALKYLSHA